MVSKIFFKHLFTSIFRRPLQPVLLILIIALGIDVGLASLCIWKYLSEDGILQAKAENGIADYTVSISSLSQTRFMSPQEMERALGEEAEVLGTFSMPLHYGDNEFVYGVAVRFSQISHFFTIEWTDYAPLSENNVENAVFISEEFSEKSGYKTGDTVELELMGERKNFTVYGISNHSFINTYDVMIDYSSVEELWGDSSLFIYSMQGEFSPSSKLYINILWEEEKAKETILTVYPECTIEKVDPVVAPFLKLMVIMIVLVSMMFAFSVIYCCCSILTVQRKEENDLFYAVGAKRYMLNIISLSEMFVYWLVGSVFGCLLSYPTTKAIIFFGNFTYCHPEVPIKYLVISALLMLIASECAMAFFCLSDYIKKYKRRRDIKEKKSRLWQLFLIGVPVLCVILGTISYFTTPKTTFPFSMTAYALVLLYAFVGGKELFSFFSLKISNWKGIKNHSLRYGLKNASCVQDLAHVTALTVLFALVSFCISNYLLLGETTNRKLANFMSGEYVVVGAGAGAIKNIQQAEGVEGAYYFFSDTCSYPGKKSGKAFATNDLACYNTDNLPIPRLPKQNEVFICKPVADYLEIGIGDDFTVSVGGRDLPMVIGELIEMNTDIIFIDAEYWGLSSNYIVVDVKDGASREAYEKIAESLSLSGGTVILSDFITKIFIKKSSAFLLCGYFMLVFICFFAFLGIGDTVVSGYRSRKEDFDCFYSAGMGKKEIAKMKFCELGYAFLFGTAMAILFASVCYYLLYESSLAFYIDITYIML